MEVWRIQILAKCVALLFHAHTARTWSSCRTPRRAPPRMLVSDIESTPNMNSFLLRLDTPLADVAGVSGVRGRTFRAGGEACPESLASVLRVDGVDSVYAMETALTVNKRASAAWFCMRLNSSLSS